VAPGVWGSRNVHNVMLQAPLGEDRCYIRRANGVVTVRTLGLVCLEVTFRRPVAKELALLLGKRPMCAVSQPWRDPSEKVLKAIAYANLARVGDYAVDEFFKKLVCCLLSGIIITVAEITNTVHKFAPLLYSYMLAPTCFGSSLSSSGSFWIRLSNVKIQSDMVVYI
jgi:hypothetical protein